MTEVRISPDRRQIAIKRDDLPEDHPMLWGVMTMDNGGHYNSAEQCADWTVVKVPDPEPAPVAAAEPAPVAASMPGGGKKK